MASKRRPFEDLIRLERENLLVKHGLLPRTGQARANSGGNPNGNGEANGGGASALCPECAAKAGKNAGGNPNGNTQWSDAAGNPSAFVSKRAFGFGARGDGDVVYASNMPNDGNQGGAASKTWFWFNCANPAKGEVQAFSFKVKNCSPRVRRYTFSAILGIESANLDIVGTYHLLIPFDFVVEVYCATVEFTVYLSPSALCEGLKSAAGSAVFGAPQLLGGKGLVSVDFTKMLGGVLSLGGALRVEQSFLECDCDTGEDHFDTTPLVSVGIRKTPNVPGSGTAGPVPEEQWRTHLRRVATGTVDKNGNFDPESGKPAAVEETDDVKFRGRRMSATAARKIREEESSESSREGEEEKALAGVAGLTAAGVVTKEVVRMLQVLQALCNEWIRKVSSGEGSREPRERMPGSSSESSEAF